jgi:hypothetical protein
MGQTSLWTRSVRSENVLEEQSNSFVVTGRGSVPFLHCTVGVVIFPLTAATNSHVAHVGPIGTAPTALLLLHLELTLFRRRSN